MQLFIYYFFAVIFDRVGRSVDSNKFYIIVFLFKKRNKLIVNHLIKYDNVYVFFFKHIYINRLLNNIVSIIDIFVIFVFKIFLDSQIISVNRLKQK